MKNKAALMTLIATALAGQSFPLIDKRENKEPKNKFNLNDEQKELLKTMTAKEKKNYLRSLNKGVSDE